MKESIKEKLAEPIQSFRLPRYRELPDVGLYLEQVVRYVNRYMILNGNELTPSMVSNYVKQKLIPGPVKKSYGEDTIAYLLFLSYTKMVVPLGDIHFMIDIQKDSYGLAVAYDYFCEEFENLLQYVYGIRANPVRVGSDDTEEKELMRSALLSVAHKIFLEQYIRILHDQREEENK